MRPQRVRGLFMAEAEPLNTECTQSPNPVWSLRPGSGIRSVRRYQVPARWLTKERCSRARDRPPADFRPGPRRTVPKMRGSSTPGLPIAEPVATHAFTVSTKLEPSAVADYFRNPPALRHASRSIGQCSSPWLDRHGLRCSIAGMIRHARASIRFMTSAGN